MDLVYRIVLFSIKDYRLTQTLYEAWYNMVYTVGQCLDCSNLEKESEWDSGFLRLYCLDSIWMGMWFLTSQTRGNQFPTQRGKQNDHPTPLVENHYFISNKFHWKGIKDTTHVQKKTRNKKAILPKTPKGDKSIKRLVHQSKHVKCLTCQGIEQKETTQ